MHWPFARYVSLHLLLAFLPLEVAAHGGVVEADDRCMLRAGWLEAHFKIYLPAQYGHRQFCEDLPDAGESVFVMEYLHDGLSSAEIDFRIIRNVTGRGRFARPEDVAAIADLDAVTVYRAPAATVPDVYTVLYRFEERGEFIGILNARPTGSEAVHSSVFPFRVGPGGAGIWLWFLSLAVVLQLQFWYLGRGVGRHRRTRPRLVLVK